MRRWPRTTQPFSSKRPRVDTTTNTIKNLKDTLALQQTVSLAGSTWNATVIQSLEFSDDAESNNYPEGDSENTLDFEDEVEVSVLRNVAVSQSLTLTQSVTVSGGREETGGGGGAETISAIFDSTAAKGAVVYVSSDGHVDLAQANADPQARAIGLATATVLATQTGEVITSGPFTNDEWALTPGAIYYLDPSVAGGISTTFPTTNGHYVIIIGTAVTPTQLNIEIHWAMVLGT